MHSLFTIDLGLLFFLFLGHLLLNRIQLLFLPITDGLRPRLAIGSLLQDLLLSLLVKGVLLLCCELLPLCVVFLDAHANTLVDLWSECAPSIEVLS